MTRKEFNKIVILEVEKYTSVNDILNLKNNTQNHLVARKLYYSIMHIMKDVNNLPYRVFQRTDKHGMMNALYYSKKHKEFRHEIKIFADMVSNRILNETK